MELGDYFDSLWNKGLQVFDKYADYEFQKLEFGIAADAHAYQAQQAAEYAQRQAQYQQGLAGGNDGLSGLGSATALMPYVLVGAGALILVLLLRK